MAADRDPHDGLDPDAAGRRIGELFDELATSLPRDAWERVAELTRLLASVHGAGLARIIERARALPDGEHVVRALSADPLVASLLVVHDIHAPAEGPPSSPPPTEQPVRLLPRRAPHR